jgi:hypothetical protein
VVTWDADLKQLSSGEITGDMIDSYLVTLTVGYAVTSSECPTDSKQFNLVVVCDPDNNAMTLTPPSAVALEYNLMTDTTPLTATYTFSHYRCGATLTFKDANDVSLMGDNFFSSTLTGDQLEVTISPTLFD